MQIPCDINEWLDIESQVFIQLFGVDISSDLFCHGYVVDLAVVAGKKLGSLCTADLLLF